MGSCSDFLFAYFLGAITFVPLVLISILLHAHYSFPTRHDVDEKDNIVQPGDDVAAIDTAKKDDSKVKETPHIDVAAGYFAVCREYTLMGINAKPIERATPMGSTTVAPPSPSVYQTMYRSIFDRKGTAVGAEGNNSMSQRPKRAGNVFYVVLRHGHLMLFDDEEQIEVRHVISLAHHNISVYSGGNVTPEGELWIKRNALCLSRKPDGGELGPDSQVSKPFYLFSENCSAKEDFYFALLKNQEQTFGAGSGSAPSPKHFDVKHIINLVQKLHSSEDNVHSRWFNAVLGRVFLGIYKTRDLENFIREKLTKKIARVKRPSFLTNITIQKIDTGEAAPYFTNMKLKDLTVEGECMLETDIRYTGNFRIEVAATVKIDLGARFKAREVNLVLAVVLKRIEGHGLLKIKPPPSNRAWISFQSMPKMEMTIEPIVSSRQITYTVILRQIESRIKEIVAETLVLPFWDDMPFFKTEHKKWRGGIFEGDDAVEVSPKDPEDLLAQGGDVDTVDQVEENPDVLAETRPFEKSHTLPIIEKNFAVSGLLGRRAARGTNSTGPSASSTSIETKASAKEPAPSSPGLMNKPTEPIVAMDSAHADLFKPSLSPPDHATNFMAALHSRSQEPPPSAMPSETTSKPASLAHPEANSSSSSLAENSGVEKDDVDGTPIAAGRRNTTSSAESASIGDSTHSPLASKAATLGRNFFLRRQDSGASNSNSATSDANSISSKKNTLAAVTSAAAQARQWGWNAIQRQKDARKVSDAGNPPVDLSQPMGRGQPLPPPGTPLPGPTNGKTKIAPIPVPKRKPIPPSTAEHSSEELHPLPHRRRRGASHDTQTEEEHEVLVVAAPDDSEPETPATENHPAISVSQSDDHSSISESWGKNTTLNTTDDELRLMTQSATSPEEPIKSPLIATPAADTDDDDDYSGWMDQDEIELLEDSPTVEVK